MAHLTGHHASPQHKVESWLQLPPQRWDAPLPYSRVVGILKTQRSEIDEVIETIHDNINQRSDLEICLPELKNILIGLMQDQFQDIKFLANKLGENHPMISMLEQERDQLVGVANKTIKMTNIFIMDTEGNNASYASDVA